MNDTERQGYVVGFLFDSHRESVLLIEKRRPSWQAGRLNGIGGHIEAGETPLEAMQREGREEAGVNPKWDYFASLRDVAGNFKVHFFSAIDSCLLDAESLTDEGVVRVPVALLSQYPVIPNLRWLVPMAMGQPVLAEIIEQ